MHLRNYEFGNGREEKKANVQYAEMDKRTHGNDLPPGKIKRFRQQQLVHQSPAGRSSSGPRRKQQFSACPVCNRSFPSFRLEEHVNQCLDSASASASASVLSSSSSAARSPLCPAGNRSFPSFRLEEHINQCLDSASTSASASALSASSSAALSPLCPADSSSGNLHYSAAQHPATTHSDDVPPSLPSPRTVKPCEPSSIWAIYPASPSEDTEFPTRSDGEILPCHYQERDIEAEIHELEEEGELELGFASDSLKDSVNADSSSSTLSSRNSLSENVATLVETNPRGQWADIFNMADISGRGGESPAVGEIRNSTGQSLDRPPPGFKLYQRQVQSQARLTMFHKLSSAATLQRNRTVTVLQPGMVLFRSWLDLEIQQKLVMESQGVAHLFHRASTAGGGKYHVYSMCWGPKWDTKTHRYVSSSAEHLLPQWMFDLAQGLASDADAYSPVYPPGSTFAADVGLVNFYPAKADELGVIGLGGHQDLDDSGVMPVVSVSVGDSMTFFYRRLPPFSRRKSGILISVDEKAAKSCEDGDNAHNREHQIVLGSGDVLVFGGESRLVYHGTRNVQPGTRPPGLHVAPGRLNFTFRQTAYKPLFENDFEV